MTDDLYARNMALLAQAAVPYREVVHEPVLDYTIAAAVRERFGLTGVESKSVLLRLKDGRYAMFISVEGKRADLRQIRDLLGSRPSLGSADELVRQTGCLSGCACPFGHQADIILIVDRAILAHEQFLYSPGPPERTVEIAVRDLTRLLRAVPNPVAWYEE